MTKTPTPSQVARHATPATNSAQVIDLTDQDRWNEEYRRALFARSQRAVMAFDLLLQRSDWECYAYTSGLTLVAMIRPTADAPGIINRCHLADGRLTPEQFEMLNALAQYEGLRTSEMLVLYLTLRYLGQGHAASAIIGKEQRTNGWRDAVAACWNEIAQVVHVWDSAGLERLTGQRVHMSDPVLMI